MELHGLNLIAGQARPGSGGPAFRAACPNDGSFLETEFSPAGPDEAARALEAAAEAFVIFRATSGETRARLLETIADSILDLGEALIERCHQESGLPRERLVGERGRTVAQLRLFASVAREGSWVEARIDRAQPDRQPLPKADLRRMLRPLGPVVVFGASNFPLAFSVAGGDTASALAAGCPVVVKAHRAHPGTAEMVGRALTDAVSKCGLPGGLFSLLHGEGATVGLALVQDPRTQAVGFTGSRQAGRALFDAACRRPQPIPVFAEMSSLNPLFALPGTLASRGPALASGLRASVTLGVGQFCTKPGLVFGIASPAWEAFLADLAREMESAAPATMLGSGICRAFHAGAEATAALAGVDVLARSTTATEAGPTQAAPVVMRTTARRFLTEPRLAEEVFGPFVLAVTADNAEELEAAARSLEGQLTATLHAEESDAAQAAALAAILETKAGRLVWNGFPTGVEVCPSMTHGGPYPATTDARFTSVGTAAILRFARPVSYQNTPEALLPAELRNDNPLGILRMIDGQWTREGGNKC